MAIISQWLLAFAVSVLCSTVQLVSSQAFNPSILQDTRDLPHTDGTFGFLYRTEDGIAHAAKGDSNGVIHGTFSYTDPTGLKVNYNYNAGSRATPGYNYDDGAAPTAAPREEYREPPQFRPQPKYRPSYRAPQYNQPQQAYREPVDVYQSSRSRNYNSRRNEVYDYN